MCGNVQHKMFLLANIGIHNLEFMQEDTGIRKFIFFPYRFLSMKKKKKHYIYMFNILIP